MSKSSADDGSSNLGCFGYGIDILDLDEGFHVLLKLLGEESLQLTSSEEFKDSFPVRRCLKLSQVWFHVTTENTQCSRFTNTIGSDETEHLTSSWDWKSMEFETIGTITVSDILGEILRQVDDFDRVEGTPSDTHTTTNTQVFRDETNSRS